jgi:hypothetical protein
MRCMISTSDSRFLCTTHLLCRRQKCLFGLISRNPVLKGFLGKRPTLGPVQVQLHRAHRADFAEQFFGHVRSSFIIRTSLASSTAIASALARP